MAESSILHPIHKDLEFMSSKWNQSCPTGRSAKIWWIPSNVSDTRLSNWDKVDINKLFMERPQQHLYSRIKKPVGSSKVAWFCSNNSYYFITILRRLLKVFLSSFLPVEVTSWRNTFFIILKTHHRLPKASLLTIKSRFMGHADMFGDRIKAGYF